MAARSPCRGVVLSVKTSSLSPVMTEASWSCFAAWAGDVSLDCAPGSAAGSVFTTAAGPPTGALKTSADGDETESAARSHTVRATASQLKPEPSAKASSLLAAGTSRSKLMASVDEIRPAPSA